jgi:hypothetical protein
MIGQTDNWDWKGIQKKRWKEMKVGDRAVLT